MSDYNLDVIWQTARDARERLDTVGIAHLSFSPDNMSHYEAVLARRPDSAVGDDPGYRPQWHAKHLLFAVLGDAGGACTVATETHWTYLQDKMPRMRVYEAKMYSVLLAGIAGRSQMEAHHRHVWGVPA